MVTILVSGSGTGVGKTRVTATLASAAARAGKRVQIVKPVQTGIAPGKPSDADNAAVLAGIGRGNAHTLRRYPAALAPLAAAAAAGVELNLQDILTEIGNLPATDIRLIEGAGGLAVPVANLIMDWSDLAVVLQAHAMILVVPDELGAINQARLVHDYLSSRNLLRKFLSQKNAPAPGLNGGVFLNALKAPPPEVATSTRAALAECHVPVWGELANDAIEPRIHQPLAELLGIA